MRTVGRTAAVAGTASAVSGRVSRRQASRQLAAQEQMEGSQQSGGGVPNAPAEPGAVVDPIDRLQQLGDMRAQGLLSEDEFAAAKAKLLAP